MPTCPSRPLSRSLLLRAVLWGLIMTLSPVLVSTSHGYYPDPSAQLLIGRWLFPAQEGPAVFECHPDGTYTITGADSEQGVYRLGPGVIYLYPQGDSPEAVSFRFLNENLIDAVNQYGERFQLVRESANGPGPDPQPGAPDGGWPPYPPGQPYGQPGPDQSPPSGYGGPSYGQPGVSSPSPGGRSSPAAQQLEKDFMQCQELMLKGDYGQAEKMALDVFEGANRLTGAEKFANGQIMRVNAAMILREIYIQQQKLDHFLQWNRAVKDLRPPVLPMLARATRISEKDARALFETQDTLKEAQVHLAMREFGQALEKAALAEKSARLILASPIAGPAAQASTLSSRLLQAWAMALLGKDEDAAAICRQVEKQLPQLQQIDMGGLILGALADPGTLARLPGEVRSVLRELIDVGDELGRYLYDLSARQWLCAVYFELGKNQAAYGHARIMKRTLPALKQAMVKLGQVSEKAADLIPEFKGLEFDLGGKFTATPFLACFGKAALRTDHLEEAGTALKEVLADPGVGHLGEIYWESLYLMGMILERKNDPDQAQTHYMRAVEAIEATRATIQSDLTKVSFLGGDRSAVYGRLIRLLTQKKEAPLAFAYAERGKAQAMVDLLAGRTIGRSASERRAVESFTGGMAAARDMKARRGLTVALLSQDEELASLQKTETITVPEIQQLLDADVTLVEYYSTESHLYIWKIDRQGMVSRTVPLADHLLERLVTAERKRLQDPGQPYAGGGPPSAYQILIQPIEATLTTGTLCFVPHGALHYLPFGAIYDGRQYLIDRFAVCQVPSATVLKYALHKGKRRISHLLAFGNPDLGNPRADLKFAEEEVNRIADARRGTRKYIRQSATETRFKQESAGAFDAIHFACHGLFESEQPLRSALMLAKDEQNDGRLTAIELYSLKINASLVSLSACETGLGFISDGDDLVGLTRGFIFSGAGTVISSLWSVDDRATALLMQSFYQALDRGSRAGALPEAQLTTKAQFGHPFFWAPFILTGDYR
jgi:CHAT domain-containing protein